MMLMLLILLAQPSSLVPIGDGPSIGVACPELTPDALKAIDMLSTKAAQAQLYDARRAIKAKPSDLDAVVRAAAIAMSLYRRNSEDTVIAAQRCGSPMLLSVPDPKGEAYKWWLTADSFYFDYIKANQAQLPEEVIRCAAKAPFDTARDLKDIHGFPRRLRTVLGFIRPEMAVPLAIYVLTETESTEAAFDVLDELSGIVTAAGLKHPKLHWLQTLAYICLRKPRKALPRLLDAQKLNPDDKKIVGNIPVVRKMLEEVEAAEKAKRAQFGP